MASGIKARWDFSGNWKKIRLTVFLAIFPAILVIIWMAGRDYPFRVEITLKLLHGKKTVAELFCKEGEFYSGAFKTTFPYDRSTHIGGNTYRFSTTLACGPGVRKLRFDPVWDRGTVLITKIKFHTYRSFDLNLRREFSQSMRILNSISKFRLTDTGILVESAGHDPFIQLSDRLQDYVKPDFPFLLMTFLFATGFFSVIFMGLLRVWSFLVLNIREVEGWRRRLSEGLDHWLVKAAAWVGSSFSSPQPLNFLTAAPVLGVSIWANWVYLSGIYSQLNLASVLAFLSAESQFSLVACCFLGLLLPFLGRRKSTATLVWGFLLLGAGAYLADAFLQQLMGMHLVHGIQMLFVGGVGNFQRNLRFTKLSSGELLLYQSALVVLLFLIFLIARLGLAFPRKARISISPRRYLMVAPTLLLIIAAEQFIGIHFKSERLVAREQSSLPFYITFRPANDNLLILPVEVRPFVRKDHRAVVEKLTAGPKAPRRIFLFILESVRADVISPETTPNLFAFRQENLSFDQEVANGNSTHYGWYAIVNSRFPIYWEKQRDLPDNLGSAPLLLLKNAGYRINVHSAKDLHYLHGLSIMFGKKKQLFDYISPHPGLPAPELDARVTDELIRMSLAQKADTKSVNIVFYDSTHFPYRWPVGMKGKKEPFAGDPTGGFPLTVARDLALHEKFMIMNRYLNSLHFNDALFGRFMRAMRKAKLLDDSLIIVVGDHGEQFMEHGFMMHGRSLYREDISVPLYMKLPGHNGNNVKLVASELDIMPTILDLCGLDTGIPTTCSGKSILSGDPHLEFTTSAAAGLQNIPYLFALVKENWKLIFELEARAPRESRRLFIKRILDSKDREFVPGEGREEDYRAFIEEHFLSDLKKIGFLHLS